MMEFRVDWHGSAVERDARAAAEAALVKGAEHLLTVANATVPLEEGILQGSGQVSSGAGASGIEASVSYDTPYARRQHEDTRLRHPNGRRAKWLERALQEESSRITGFVRDELDRRLS